MCEESLVFWAPFLGTWGGADLGTEIGRWGEADLGTEITNQITENFTYMTWVIVFRTELEVVKTCLAAFFTSCAAILSFFKWGCIVVHMHRGIRNSSSRFKMQLQKYGPPHVTRNVSQNTRPHLCFSRRIWEWEWLASMMVSLTLYRLSYVLNRRSNTRNRTFQKLQDL